MLETIVIEMAKKLVKLEVELQDIKNIQTQSETTKENESSIEKSHENYREKNHSSGTTQNKGSSVKIKQ